MATGKTAQLPGYRVLPVPCSGWVSPFLIERALKKGAKGILVVGCGPEPMYRTGTLWTELRLEGKRTPVARESKIDPAKVRFMRYDRSSREEFLKNAREFLEEDHRGQKAGSQRKSLPGFLSIGVAALISFLFFLAAYGLTQLSFQEKSPYPAALVVSFNHPGQFAKVKGPKTPPPSQKDVLPHMRQQGMIPGAGQRKRVPVRMEVYVDGKKVLARSYPPRGLFGDSASVALESLAIKPGRHLVEIRLGDSVDPKEWSFIFKKELFFPKDTRRVVLFDKVQGFRDF